MCGRPFGGATPISASTRGLGQPVEAQQQPSGSGDTTRAGQASAETALTTVAPVTDQHGITTSPTLAAGAADPASAAQTTRPAGSTVAGEKAGIAAGAAYTSDAACACSAATGPAAPG